jgi:uncharacterized membrane protein YbhN (UPF0104 family)
VGAIAGKAYSLLRSNWLAALALGGVAALVMVVNPAQLARVFGRADRQIVLVMVPTTLAVFAVRGVGWWFALRRIGVRISPARAVVILFASKPMVFLPAGDLGRVAVLEATGAIEGLSVGEVTATVAFQEMGFLALMGLPLVPALAVEPALAPLVLFLALVLALILAVLLWEPMHLRAVALVERIPFLGRFDRELRHIRPAFLKLFEARTIAGVLAFDALAVALTFLLFELALHVVGATRVGLLQASFSYAVAYVVSGLAFTPVGLGAYEGIITGFMVLQGVPPSQGAAAALLYRGFNDVFMALVGLAFLAGLRRAGQKGLAERRVRPSAAE